MTRSVMSRVLLPVKLRTHVVPQTGIEPVTCGFSVHYSTAELPRLINGSPEESRTPDSGLTDQYFHQLNYGTMFLGGRGGI